MTKILIKKVNSNAVIPKYETPGASGLDLSACLDNKIVIKPGNKELISTGISLSIPKEFEIQIRPRSGLANRNSISVLNTPGTIDSDYRGEIKVLLFNFGKNDFEVVNGLRVAQMVLCPIAKAELSEVNNLDDTTRGDGGFGSTGK
jgi:dUTP pyrophosphatase